MAKKIINNIRKLRFEHDEMTQSTLAKALGVTRQTVAAMEGNKYPPSLELAFKLADLFDEDISYVFEYVDE